MFNLQYEHQALYYFMRKHSKNCATVGAMGDLFRDPLNPLAPYQDYVAAVCKGGPQIGTRQSLGELWCFCSYFQC